jgi:hypothetical protein
MEVSKLMACNPVRFLGEVAHNPNLTLEQIKHGLSYSPVGDCIEFDDWQTLYNAEGIGEVRDKAFNMLPDYWKVWEQLGKPSTAELWHKARFSTPEEARVL